MATEKMGLPSIDEMVVRVDEGKVNSMINDGVNVNEYVKTLTPLIAQVLAVYTTIKESEEYTPLRRGLGWILTNNVRDKLINDLREVDGLVGEIYEDGNTTTTHRALDNTKVLVQANPMRQFEGFYKSAMGNFGTLRMQLSNLLNDDKLTATRSEPKRSGGGNTSAGESGFGMGKKKKKNNRSPRR